MSDLEAVVFDFDGLIVDTESPALDSWRELYAEHGHDFPLDRWHAIVGTIGHLDVVGDLEALVGRPLERDVLLARRRRRKDELLAGTGPLPGVVERVREAQQLGLRLAIASSSSTRWVGAHLERIGLAGAFEVLACADGDPERAKPAPTVYAEACAGLGVAPSAAVAIEDSPNGVAAAKAAGLACIAVPNPITEALDLSAADLVVPSLADRALADLLADLPR